MSDHLALRQSTMSIHAGLLTSEFLRLSDVSGRIERFSRGWSGLGAHGDGEFGRTPVQCRERVHLSTMTRSRFLRRCRQGGSPGIPGDDSCAFEMLHHIVSCTTSGVADRNRGASQERALAPNFDLSPFDSAVSNGATRSRFGLHQYSTLVALGTCTGSVHIRLLSVAHPLPRMDPTQGSSEAGPSRLPYTSIDNDTQAKPTPPPPPPSLPVVDPVPHDPSDLQRAQQQQQPRGGSRGPPQIVPTVLAADGIREVPWLFELCEVEDLITLICKPMTRLCVTSLCMLTTLQQLPCSIA